MTRFGTVLARVAPFGLLALSVAGLVGEIVVTSRESSVAPSTAAWLAHLAFPLATVAFAVVGGFLARRRPRNPMGWALLVFGLGPLNVFAGSYAEARYAGWEVATWWYAAGWSLGMASLWAALLVFPDGRPISPRWRWVVRAAVGALVTTVIMAAALWPHRGAILLADVTAFPLPARIPALVQIVVVGLTAATGLVSLALRYRRSVGIERQQLKWLLAAVTPIVAGFVWNSLAGTSPESPTAPFAATTLMIGGTLGLPVAMAIAILRYRLYAIDRFVHRGAVYAVVTAVLLATYLTSVLVLQRLLAPLGGANDLSVAGSTLLAAAAFGPVRRRAQGLIDRRFNRRRYDATRIIDGFGQRLRNEIDVAALRGAVQDVAGRTMEPASASVWLIARSGH